MSRCVACDRLLSDREAKRKHQYTREEIGLCDVCLAEVEEIQHIPVADDEDIYIEDDLSEMEIDELIESELNFPDESEEE